MAQVHCVFCWNLEVGQDFRCTAHRHDCTEIVYSDSGAGVLKQSGKDYIYTDKSVFVYQPGTPHWVENRIAGNHICIGVIGGRAEELREGLWQASESLQRRFVELHEVLKINNRIKEDRLDLLSGLVVCDLLEIDPTYRWPTPNRAHQTKDFIEGALGSDISVADLADRAFVSRDYLRQLFREAFGESVTHYILRRRIEVASKLLLTTQNSVKQIAHQTGFHNEYYFSRAFRKLMGMPPTAYRKHGLESYGSGES